MGHKIHWLDRCANCSASSCIAGTDAVVDTSFVPSADDEINLLVIVVDVNPIFWGQQAQRDPEVLKS